MSTKTIRVRVHAGRLEPLEHLALPEGTEMSMRFDTPVAGSPAAVLSVVRKLPQLDPSAVNELERVIEEGKLPVRSESVFDRPEA